jgi:signal transduction histidine kinase
VAFAFVAVIAGGSEAPIGAACAIAAASVLGVEISGVIFGLANGTALGLPLLLVAGLLAGRNRREVRMRADQADELVTQMQLSQDEHQRAAALNERNRIAREIHDVLAHSISALGIQIQAARSVLHDSGDVEGTLRLLDGAQRLAEDGLTDSRRAILALRNDTPPLPASMATLVDSHAHQHHDPVDFVITGQVRPLQPDANLALVRTTHEALTNASKHAPGGSIRICLNYVHMQTTLTIANTPARRDPHKSAAAAPSSGVSGGYGLAGMRERLLLIGGTLTAGPLGDGWIVQAKVPQ